MTIQIQEGTKGVITYKFKITYYAEKHGKHITRTVKWTAQCREWISKAGQKLFTYYDLDNNGYRTAKGDYMISVRGNQS